MTHASLFSGIGGFDLAAQWAGFENMFACEIDKFCQTVLQYYLPTITIYDDIKTTDFTEWKGKVNILSGGFPCQPFSIAGKRMGRDDDRYLWAEMLRAIRQISPTYIVAENVPGLFTIEKGLVFESVCRDLENAGYEVQPFIIPSCAVGAPHRRDRLWIVAKNAERIRCNSVKPKEKSCEWEQRELGAGNNVRVCREEGFVTYGTDTGTESVQRWKKPAGEYEFVANAKGFGWGAWRKKDKRHKGCELDSEPLRLVETEFVANPTGKRYKKRTKYQTIECMQDNRFAAFPTQSPVCRRDDGFSAKLDGITFPAWRSASIKGFGNAIVPQVVLRIFEAIKSDI